MHIDCPQCGKNNDLDCDDLPRDACDDKDYTCVYDDCEHVFSIGWFAEAELR